MWEFMLFCVLIFLNHVMAGFLGEYEVAMDAKGRFLLPAVLKKQLPENAANSFVIARGFEPHLNLYTLEDWNKIAEKINQYNDLKPQVRKFKRLFFSGAMPVDLDSAGRLLLPKNLQEYASLSKEIVLTAQGNRIEIWDKQAYHNYLKDNIDDMSDLADEIGGDGFISPF